MSAPTLLVGLGGKGSDIILRVSKKVTEEQRKQMEFVVLDTDVNELSKINKISPFVHTIQTSTNSTVGEYLDIDNKARDEWFPVNAILNNKALSEGAGQVRSVSRLAFETAVRSGKMEKLDRAIENLYKLEGGEYEQSLRVVVVSTLAGGTGSGLILPVGLYIKNFLATRFRNGANICRGFFLLPEVLYDVIPGNPERNNLKSNAYATLREIDAFMMKGDGQLPDKFKDSVKIEFPKAGTDTYEEYNVRPYDYCFLFDAQNVDGKKLNSFDAYLEHAADCIYAQSIGPMNKRSNSSEDNTIRALCREKGRNRYAGAGTSILKYPVEDIKEYIALGWANQTISENWLKYDKEFVKQQESFRQKRRKGIRVPEVKRNENYVFNVEDLAKHKQDSFSKEIIECCKIHEADGITSRGNKWDIYVSSIDEKIKREQEVSGHSRMGASMLEIAKSDYFNAITAIEPAKEADVFEAVKETYNMAMRYKNVNFKYIDDNSSTISFNIFDVNDNAVEEATEFQIEYYLYAEDGSFMHPNAIRYFLYKTFLTMQQAIAQLEKDTGKLLREIENFDTIFDDGRTDDKVETIDEIEKTFKYTLIENLKQNHQLSDGVEGLKSKFGSLIKDIDDYRKKSILLAVYKEGLNYVSNMSDAFERFYDALAPQIANLERKANSIVQKYTSSRGTAARYVCVSKTCFQGIYNENPYMESSAQIDPELAKTIYNRVNKYAQLQSKPNNDAFLESFFKDMFNNNIIEYFRKQVMISHSETIDLDIIQAIEKEAEYEGNIVDTDKINSYVISVINECKNLAAPFIEKPFGEEKQPIYSCAYNDKLNPHDDSPKSQLINKELKSFGGEEDSEIAKNTVFFYKSIYGLRANDLSKFSPAKQTDTFNRLPGEYYKAYYDLVTQINPESHKSRVISPHINKWWHNASKMPDLDDTNQQEQENEVYAAFFWGMLCDYFDRFLVGNDEYVYRFNSEIVENRNEDETNMIVSNGTPCDRLYEVLDSLGVFPAFTKKINESVDAIIRDELDRNIHIISYEEPTIDETNVSPKTCRLFRELSTFRLKEYPLFSDDENKESLVRSIFDLPFLFKKSVVPELYFEDKVRKMLEIEISEIERYLKAFCTGDQLPLVMGPLLLSQFDKYLRDLELETKINGWHGVYSDYLFDATCKLVANELKKLGLREEADLVLVKSDKLRK